MKNHYEVLGLKQNATTKKIKEHYELGLKELKKLTSNPKKILKITNKLKQSYEALTDYHTRKKLDEYLNNKMGKNKIDINRINQLVNIPNNKLVNQFFKNFLVNSKKTKSIDKSENIDKKYYYHSSFTSSKIDNDNNKILEQKTITNDNGKIEGNHTITEKDKDGKETVTNIPLKINEYLIKD